MPRSCSPLSNPPLSALWTSFQKMSRRATVSNVASTLTLLKNTACQLEACSPCVRHKGTKDAATVTDWMLHTAPVSPSERPRLCMRAFLFVVVWQFHVKFSSRERENDRLHRGSKNKTTVCSRFIVVPLLFSKKTISWLFIYFTVTSTSCCLKAQYAAVVFIVTSLRCDENSYVSGPQHAACFAVFYWIYRHINSHQTLELYRRQGCSNSLVLEATQMMRKAVNCQNVQVSRGTRRAHFSFKKAGDRRFL